MFKRESEREREQGLSLPHLRRFNVRLKSLSLPNAQLRHPTDGGSADAPNRPKKFARVFKDILRRIVITFLERVKYVVSC